MPKLKITELETCLHTDKGARIEPPHLVLPFAHSIDPDEVDHDEPPHLDQLCLPYSL